MKNFTLGLTVLATLATLSTVSFADETKPTSTTSVTLESVKDAIATNRDDLIVLGAKGKVRMAQYKKTFILSNIKRGKLKAENCTSLKASLKEINANLFSISMEALKLQGTDISESQLSNLVDQESKASDSINSAIEHCRNIPVSIEEIEAAKKAVNEMGKSLEQ